jgi:hypothetical protein
MKIVRDSCEECDFLEFARIPRRFWMRLLPSLRHYHCKRCDADVLAPKDKVEARQWMMSTFKGHAPPAEPQPPT